MRKGEEIDGQGEPGQADGRGRRWIQGLETTEDGIVEGTGDDVVADGGQRVFLGERREAGDLGEEHGD